MTISLSQASVDVVVQMLTGLCGVLDKASAFCAERHIDEGALLTMRFAPNMYPFTRQVQAVAKWGERIPAFLGGIEIARPSDQERSLADLKSRLEAVIALAHRVDRKVVDHATEKELTFSAGGVETKHMKGRDYALSYALPHLFFHATTAYDLLRHAGVPLEKADYMGPVRGFIE